MEGMGILTVQDVVEHKDALVAVEQGDVVPVAAQGGYNFG